jgi:hypothetical protein
LTDAYIALARERRARARASEELLNHPETHPRPAEEYFRGQDTRVGYLGVRHRLTSQQQAGRDWYERLEHEERERGIAA